LNWRMVAVAIVALLASLPSARADSCSRSRDFLLEDAADLPKKPSAYQELYRNCIEVLRLSNVQDAFILKVGAIAVIPRRDGLMATASTLARFCERFPHGTLHFIKRKDQRQALNIAKAVRMSAPNPTPCERIKGGG
jgi:hypothetical protein